MKEKPTEGEMQLMVHIPFSLHTCMQRYRATHSISKKRMVELALYLFFTHGARYNSELDEKFITEKLKKPMMLEPSTYQRKKGERSAMVEGGPDEEI